MTKRYWVSLVLRLIVGSGILVVAWRTSHWSVALMLSLFFVAFELHVHNHNVRDVLRQEVLELLESIENDTGTIPPELWIRIRKAVRNARMAGA